MSDPKVIKFPNQRESATVEIELHPDEVIDVDPQILAVMKARLAGESLDYLFSRDDQTTNELAIERERQKLKAMFKDASEVYGSFSSLNAIKETKSRLRDHKVDRDLLALYANRKSAGQSIDEADLYAHLISGCELQPKQSRLDSLRKLTPTLGPKARELVISVEGHYLREGFGSFSVSKEMIELSPVLRDQLKSGEIQSAVNEVLGVLYRGME